MRLAPIILLALALPVGRVVAAAVELSEDEKAMLQLYGAEEMVSIATGTRQPLRRAPSVASVITAADIKAMGATDIDEVLETVPGLHVARDNIGFAPIYTFRGIHSTFNQQVLVLVNGIPITNVYAGNRSTAWGGMPVQAIARIEVVRGPGSAVYGADASAGVINIITKTKDDMNGTEIGGRIGSFDTYDGWGLHGGEWAGFDVAAMVEYHKTNGPDSIVDADLQTFFDNVLGTRASLAPGPVSLTRDNLDARLDLSRGHWRWRGGLQHRGNLGMGAGLAQALDPHSRNESDRWNTDLTYHNPEFAEHWDVQAQASYFHTSIVNTRDNRLLPPGTVLPIGADGNINGVSPLGLVTFPQGFIGNPSGFENHARVNLSGVYTGFEDHQIRLGTGYNYSALWAKEKKNFGINPFTGVPIPFSGSLALVNVTGTPAVYIGKPDRQNYFFYVQDEWKFARDWQLTGGVRYDYYSDFGDTVNPRAALVWDLRYDLTAKLMYGSAFRAPSFQEMHAVNNPVTLGNPSLAPETLDTVEVAFDYRPRDNLRLGWNVFHYWWNDIIRFVADPGGGSFTAQNTGRQEGTGTELEAEWKATDSLKLIGNYSFQKSMDEALDHDAGNAPHHQVYLRANWEFLPDWQFVPQAKWILDRDRAEGDDRPEIGDYTWVDLTLRRTRLADHFEVAFSVRNLFDVDAREPSLPGPPLAIPNDLPLAGRSFFGEIRVRF
jgi:iron complex outermembrane receptor protein